MARAFIVACCLLLVGNIATSHAQQSNRKQAVYNLIKSIETRDPTAGAIINPNKYIQHNLGVADGVAGFMDFLGTMPAGSCSATPVRVFQDGDYVFAQTDYVLNGPEMVGFDIFRFENGLIVEHWDNLQPIENMTNPSGHTQLDGPTQVRDLDQTEANKALVRDFLTTVLQQGQVGRLGDYFDCIRYIQHNPMVGDGLLNLTMMIARMGPSMMTLDQVHMVLGEGNFVLSVCEGTWMGQPAAFYDLFRVENGKIAEHWDTMQMIPPQSAWKNSNGKFK